MTETLSEKRARAGRKGGKAKVKKGFATNKELAREAARKSHQKAEKPE